MPPYPPQGHWAYQPDATIRIKVFGSILLTNSKKKSTSSILNTGDCAVIVPPFAVIAGQIRRHAQRRGCPLGHGPGGNGFSAYPYLWGTAGGGPVVAITASEGQAHLKDYQLLITRMVWSFKGPTPECERGPWLKPPDKGPAVGPSP